MTPPAPGSLRTLIVDDEALARQRLGEMLAAHPEVRIVGEAESGTGAVAAILRERPDLVFLDVQMPGLDGFGVLRCTAGAHHPIVVFVTAYDEYAVRAFDMHAADYLMKPVTAPRLAETVRRAVARAAAGPPRTGEGLESLLRDLPPTPAAAARLPVRGPDGTDLVDVASITWVEADGDHATLHSIRGAQRIRGTMAELAARLSPFGFVRVHRGAIVNAAEVARVEPIEKGNWFLILRGGLRVRTGRGYREAVRRLKAD